MGEDLLEKDTYKRPIEEMTFEKMPKAMEQVMRRCGGRDVLGRARTLYEGAVSEMS